MRYEVRRIDKEGEAVVSEYDDQAHAFEDCLRRWEGRRAGGSFFAVRDTETEQRWSYRDIMDLRFPPPAAEARK